MPKLGRYENLEVHTDDHITYRLRPRHVRPPRAPAIARFAVTVAVIALVSGFIGLAGALIWGLTSTIH